MLTIGRAIIDDMPYVPQAKYGSVKLPAGVHRIKWAVIFGVSVMVDANIHVPLYAAPFGIASCSNKTVLEVTEEKGD
ncbi:MAG: hypothetical protein K0B01_11990 [Syntrophobacterales bacterium]|nr:hypothetical protein [Syntrophobacterales bacterium]